MEKSGRQSRKQYPVRIHIQVTEALAAQIKVVVEREYGGSIPELGRQALQSLCRPERSGEEGCHGRHATEAVERMEALLRSIHETVSPHDTVLITLQEEVAKLTTKVEGVSKDDQVLREEVKDLRPVLSNLTEAVAELPYRGSSQSQ